jgi:phosphoadenosine phosphosulfate reductase
MNIENLAEELRNKSPRDIIKKAYSSVDNLAISFSGAEDVVLIDMAHKLGLKPHVFTLDTGRLHSETYQFIETVMEHYDIKIQVLSPDKHALEKLTKEKGLFSFYRDGHKECCGIRKVQPLKQHLINFSGWLTGQRQDQSQQTRGNLSTVEIDNAFEGKEGQLIKFNPLCHWTSEEVWSYIRALELPFNPLHSRGYESIGCEPCTRSTLPNQDPREGRWWWEQADSKECGLHSK